MFKTRLCVVFCLIRSALPAQVQTTARPADLASALTIAGTETASGLTWSQEIRQQPAGKVLRNVQVMTEIPAERFMAAMQSTEASLGVKCEHCHNRDLYRSDEKPAKLTARQMLKMAYSTNQKHFDGQDRITCYVCHRGTTKPETAVPTRAPASPKQPPAKLSAEEGAKPSAEVYKNIQVAKSIPAGRLMRMMGVFTIVLGVECDHCHVEGRWDSDEKKPKQTARKMIQMVGAIAADHFEGKPQVACWTCHRGASKPPRSVREAPSAAGL